MEKEDQFDKETGFDVAISETGINVKAKSRIVSTLDRWGGNFLRKKSFKGERAVQTDEQLISLEAKIVQKAGEKLFKRVDEDDDFALEVLNIAYTREARRRDNKEGVILAALEILKNEAAGESESIEGPDQLSDEFLDRVERYAEDASTEELKQRWGRILAGEIRKPGTFSKKVLRSVDEIDTKTATLFEKFGKFGFNDAIYQVIAPSPNYHQRVRLLSAGIFTKEDDDQVRFFTSGRLDDGRTIWMLDLGSFAIGFLMGTVVDYTKPDILLFHENRPSTPIYLLSDVGEALLNLIERDERTNARNLASKIAQVLPQGSQLLFEKDDDGQTWRRVSNF
ncbi:DUF2806 domain-containing protein [Brucella pituitosa]|uniref:DUF2806 domain-containing protein n=1 Tax=Brucella pituitosa TaxID=571256 RepID=UPI0020063FEE|nr:DUF2806 domain-containing protein [Brucella pituitosa]MCK4207184.1 DUF2806 domain-containing protein [Brucella pituitosa]